MRPAMASPWRRDSTPKPHAPPSGTVVGTHGFMAPEQARGETDASGRGRHLRSRCSSVLLTKREAPVPAGVPALALHQEKPPIPRPLRSICARATAASPADRYPSAAALGDEVPRAIVPDKPCTPIVRPPSSGRAGS